MARLTELMQESSPKTKAREKPLSFPEKNYITDPDFESPISPIKEFVDLPDFPRCALGKHINIGGSTGVVVQIVNQSIKIKTVEGTIQSFNTIRLRILHGRPQYREVLRNERGQETREPLEQLEAPSPAEPPEAKQDIPAPLDFNREPKPISMFAARPDFPTCARGEYLDIGGYTGIVVDIVKHSLKVRASDGSMRSYNEEALRKLYGKSTAPVFGHKASGS